MMYIFCLFSLVLISVAHADVSHLSNNLQADGYHYEQPSYPFPSENEIIPQQPLSGRNDFNPPAFLAQQKPEEPAPQLVPELTPAPQLEYIPPAPSPVETNLQEDGYHYQQPFIPFPSGNEVIPQQQLSGRNDFNPPAFLAQPTAQEPEPEQPAQQEPEPEQPAQQEPEPEQPVQQEPIPEEPIVIAPQPSFVESNLQEDGYHYQQPSIPFESQQSLSGRNDFNPPAFLLATPEPEEPEPEAPASQAPEPVEPEPEAPAPQEPEPVEIVSEEPVPEAPIQPAPTPVEVNLQDDGYNTQPLIPFGLPEPAQQYLPVAQPAPVQPQPELSSYFGPVETEQEPSYSLGPNGYNYRVPSRPFRF